VSSVLGTVGNALTAASVVGPLGDIGAAATLGEAATTQVAAVLEATTGALRVSAGAGTLFVAGADLAIDGRLLNGVAEGAGSVNRGAFKLNRFNQTAQNLPKTSQQNIRTLRGWAKSRGYEKLPNPEGGPEKWGIFNKGEFRTHLIIKPEASLRPGLDPRSGIPRFDAKIADGIFINPFSGRTGTYKQYSHIALEKPYSAYELELNNKPISKGLYL